MNNIESLPLFGNITTTTIVGKFLLSGDFFLLSEDFGEEWEYFREYRLTNFHHHHHHYHEFTHQNLY